MKLKEYMKRLDNFTKIFPEALELDVIYAQDDEGNAFLKLYYGPTLDVLDGIDFSIEEEFNKNCNAVCLN